LDHPIPFLKKRIITTFTWSERDAVQKEEKTPFYVCALLEAEAITPGRTETLDKR
jgi:hypothetical protein